MVAAPKREEGRCFAKEGASTPCGLELCLVSSWGRLWVVRGGLCLGAKFESSPHVICCQTLADIMAAADPEQRAMMAEAVILLDEDDNVIGHGSKKDTHLMENINKGMLHRAFSVFMFNSEGKLLLQQRSSDKITFPAYWANTCCSHPLYTESELIEEGQRGVINAARRKLEQELGINPADVPPSCFQFLTRVHYKAASDGIWGEHEIDYILICTPPKDPVVRPNPNEVATVRWFDPAGLRSFVANSYDSGDLISPWFRIIENTLLHPWWEAVKAGNVTKFVDGRIHRAGDFTDPSVASALGLKTNSTAAADAASAKEGSQGFSSAARSTSRSPSSGASLGAASKKQGAYGKVRTHKEPAWKQLMHVDEVFHAIAFKYASRASTRRLPAGTPSDYVFCEDMLCRVSRSFAAVIQQLPSGLRESVCVFYLVLRALDTVEDDMDAFDDVNVKVAELLAFHTHLHDASWSMSGVGQADEARLLEQFGSVTSVFQRLPAGHRDVIEDITRKMAEGMARFIRRDLQQGTKDTSEYNLYCHYVAGLVGHGLSRLFSASGREAPSVAQNLDLANDMGLFLQKTNIIRDYLEDWVDKRAFWPGDIWRKHASSLGAFAHGENRAAGLRCLNEMVTNALSHAPRCLEYMEQLQDPAVFAFCAIPQVMAIATLEKCYNNPDVFTGVVKIRKGTACKLIRQAKTMPALYGVFLGYANTFLRRMDHSDPSAKEMHATLLRLQRICSEKVSVGACHPMNAASVAVGVALVGNLWVIKKRCHLWDGYMPRITSSVDVRCRGSSCLLHLITATHTHHPSPPSLVAPLPLVSHTNAMTQASLRAYTKGTLGAILLPSWHGHFGINYPTHTHTHPVPIPP